MSELYFLILRKWQDSGKFGFWFWVYGRYVAVLEIKKHIRRGNYKYALLNWVPRLIK